MLLEDRVAIITGGAGVNGLGFGTARMMAAQGARIVILDLKEPILHKRPPCSAATISGWLPT